MAILDFILNKKNINKEHTSNIEPDLSKEIKAIFLEKPASKLEIKRQHLIKNYLNNNPNQNPPIKPCLKCGCSFFHRYLNDEVFYCDYCVPILFKDSNLKHHFTLPEDSKDLQNIPIDIQNLKNNLFLSCKSLIAPQTILRNQLRWELALIASDLDFAQDRTKLIARVFNGSLERMTGNFAGYSDDEIDIVEKLLELLKNPEPS